ncbi:MAG: TonB-dependent receptor [Flavipsychrobacter sp.]|nr:TonB-dependent receptor [Flavipsychrobacter sp.]
MLYLFQVTVYSALLYVIYITVIKDRAAHSFSRAYLLLCATLPLAIPFMYIPALADNIIQLPGITRILLPDVTILSKGGIATANGGLTFNILAASYLLITLVLIARTAIQYISFIRFVKRHEYKTINGVKVLLNTQTGPGSFMQYIFLPGSSIDPVIYEHELAHIRSKHSVDILFMRILRACFWPNVVLYFINKELKIIHEFQADARSVSNKETYINALLNDTFNTNCFALSHTFFYHPLKRRIMMLQKAPLSHAKLRNTVLKTCFSAVVVLSGIIYLQSCKPQAEPQKDKPAAMKTVYDTISAGKISGHREVLTFAEKMPTTNYDLGKYLGQNIKYPENARKKGIQGRVIVRFIVNENGAVSDASVVNAADPELAAEALRVISAMPPWTPAEQKGQKVAVYFTQPISFKI